MQLYNSQAGLPNQSGTRITLIFASVGIRGDTGLTPNITIGTTTDLPNGSSAYVTNTGTINDPVFNFGLVSGKDGIGKDGKDGTNASDSVGLIATNAAIAVVASNVAALDVIVTGHTTNLGVINPIIATQTTTLASHTTSISNLDIKTADLSCDLIGSTFARSLAIGSLIDLNSTNGKIICNNLQLDNLTIDSNGNINTTGNIVCNNISSNQFHSYDDSITGLSTVDIGIHAIKINVGSFTTSTTNIEGSTIRIGTSSLLNDIYIGNSFSNVTISCYNNNSIKVSNFIDQF
jgi:hypothetical protein